MAKKITRLVDRVTRLLRDKSTLRDNDRRLTCNIWWKSVPNPKLLMFEDLNSILGLKASVSSVASPSTPFIASVRLSTSKHLISR